MEYIQLIVQSIEGLAGAVLAVVTVGLWISTRRYRKSTEEMTIIQQKGLEIELRSIEGRQKSVEVQQQNVEVQQQNVEVQQQNVDYLKKDNALRLLERWDNRGLVEARRFIRDLSTRRTSLSDEELLEEIEGNQGEEAIRESLVYVFNFWKSVQWAIASESTDEEILREAYRSIYISMYHRFEVWLDVQPPGYKEDLAKLYNRWKSASSQ